MAVNNKSLIPNFLDNLPHSFILMIPEDLLQAPMLMSHVGCKLFVSHGSGLLTGALFTSVFECFPKQIVNSSIRINILRVRFVFLKINSISKVKQTEQAKKQASRQASKQGSRQALGVHSVGAMPWRGLSYF